MNVPTGGKLRFTSVIRIRGVNPYISISRARAARIRSGWRKSLPVLVRINAQPKRPWRINMMPIGNGGFYLYLHETVRKASGAAVGDRVAVELGFDDDYRAGPAHPMPPWFRVPLAKHTRAKKAWELLTPSRKKEILRYFAGLKSLEARTRNVERALSALSGKKERFMARSWKDGV